MAADTKETTKDDFQMKFSENIQSVKGIDWAVFQDASGDIYIKQPDAQGGKFEVIEWPKNPPKDQGGGKLTQG